MSSRVQPYLPAGRNGAAAPDTPEAGLPAPVAGPLPPLLLTPLEAARHLSVSPRTLWSMTRDGTVRCVRLGRLVRYTVADLQAAVDRLRAAGGK